MVLPALLLALPCTAAQKQLDAHFVEKRVLVDAPLRGEGLVRFWTDTGGGGTIIYDKTAVRLKLATGPIAGEMADEMPPGSKPLTAALPLAPSAVPTPPAPVLVTGAPLPLFGLPAAVARRFAQGLSAGDSRPVGLASGSLG